jgi:hypothetical protein
VTSPPKKNRKNEKIKIKKSKHPFGCCHIGGPRAACGKFMLRLANTKKKKKERSKKKEIKKKKSATQKETKLKERDRKSRKKKKNAKKSSAHETKSYETRI